MMSGAGQSGPGTSPHQAAQDPGEGLRQQLPEEAPRADHQSGRRAPAGLADRVRPLAQPGRRGREKIRRFRERELVMATAIFAALLGLVIGTAAIGIPQLVRIRHQQPDHDDTQAYLTATGRSARDIAQGNAVVRERQQNQARAPGERR
jgi:hypothetical protein